jgi:hypothetical protein
VPRRRVKVVRTTDVPAHPEVDPVFAPGAVEETLQQRCEEIAKGYGWLVHHNADSRRADAGLPDLVMVSPVLPDGTTVLALLELKRDRGTTTDVQQQWLDRLALVTSVVTGVVRPRDWPGFVNLSFDPQDTTTTSATTNLKE